MRFRLQLALGLLTAMLLGGCTGRNDAVVVHVFRDASSPSAAVLSRRIAHFRSLNVRTPSRKLIVLNETDSDYLGTLGKLGNESTTELVILNSERDVETNPRLQEELAHAIDLCTDGQRCLAFIPSWVSGEQRTAAQMVLNSLLAD